MLLLGLDIGTTGVKAMVLDENGKPAGYAFSEYPVSYPGPGRAEQDGEMVWTAAKAVIRRAVGEQGSGIGAIALSTQGDAVIAVDKNRMALSPAYLGMDYRGTEETELCSRQFGALSLFQRTGMRPHPMNSIIKILWIRQHQPELFEQTHKFVTYGDFILGKLGSEELVIDYTMAGRTMAFSQETMDWDYRLLDSLGIPAEKLGLPTASCQVVGSLAPAAADELGLSSTVLLVTGGHDQTCAALGAGIVSEGTALDSHGTAEVLSSVFSSPRLSPLMFESYYPCYPYLLPEHYFTFALNHTGGLLLRWFAETFCQEEMAKAAGSGESIYDRIIGRLDSSGPSPLLVLPHFNGSGTPYCDWNSKGAILGLTMATGKEDVAKALLESLSYELRLNAETMKKAGIPISGLRAVGGGAKSPFGLQNKADILGLPVSSLQIREAACLGAALCAGLALGFYRDGKEAAGTVRLGLTYEPRPAIHRAYSEKYYTYSKMYVTMKEILYAI